MSRKTQKYMSAVRILADELQTKALQITEAYNNREIYAELQSMNYTWDEMERRWNKRGLSWSNQPKNTYTAVLVSIRVSADNVIEAEVGAKNIIYAFDEAGFTVVRQSATHKNGQDEGARIYLDVLM
jgi:hypothetical protein